MTEQKSDKILNELASFKSTINQRFDQVDARLNKIELRFDIVEARLDKVESRLDKVESGVVNLAVAMADHNQTAA